MTTELGFKLGAPDVSEFEIACLVSDLQWCGGKWATARHLSVAGYTDRKLRAIAEASNGRIISGQKGYALLENCTPDEIDHAAGWLESQGKKMLQRAARIRARFHRYGGASA